MVREFLKIAVADTVFIAFVKNNAAKSKVLHVLN